MRVRGPGGSTGRAQEWEGGPDTGPALPLRPTARRSARVHGLTWTIVEVHRRGMTPAISELTVGEVSRRSGVAVSALHFYEREGLIHSRRTSGNQRRFKREVLRRIAFIRIAQRVGVPLAQVRASLEELPDSRTPTRADWEALSRTWRSELDDRIRRLQQLRDDFSGCIGCGCLSLDRCAMANPGDQLGEEGPGPRRLA